MSARARSNLRSRSTREEPGALASFVARTIERVESAPVSFARLHPEAIPGSMVTGAAGVAFFLLEAARLRGEHRLHDRARAWSRAARRWTDAATMADWKWSERGFLNGASGLAFVEALLAAEEADDAAVVRAIERMDRAMVMRSDLRATELYGGFAGIACAAMGLERRLAATASAAVRDAVSAVRGRATTALAKAYARRSARGKVDLLGMAHGVAGELWALVALLGPDHALVRPRLDELAELRKTDASGLVYWLPARRGGGTSFVETWCHGVTGHSLLWTEVARRSRSARFDRLAAETAKTVAALSFGGPSVCCGLAGQSVVLQRHSDVSGDRRLARLAYERLVRAARDIEAPVWNKVRFGLWQGALGVALVAMARLTGERAFPCIEPPLNAAPRG